MPLKEMKGEKMTTQQPAANFRAGTITAAVWENDIEINGNQIKALRTSVERRFRTKEGQWKSSSTFSRNDIPLAIHCLQKAFDFMVERNSNKEVITNES